jgi:hypothetical protein
MVAAYNLLAFTIFLSVPHARTLILKYTPVEFYLLYMGVKVSTHMERILA